MKKTAKERGGITLVELGRVEEAEESFQNGIT